MTRIERWAALTVAVGEVAVAFTCLDGADGWPLRIVLLIGATCGVLTWGWPSR